MAQNKGRKQQERKNAILDRMREADAYYQKERKKRMEEMSGAGATQEPTVVSPQVRKVVLPAVSGVSTTLPAAAVRPSHQPEINGQQPVVHFLPPIAPMDQDLPEGADENL